jgi:hypothetical protein
MNRHRKLLKMFFFTVAIPFVSCNNSDTKQVNRLSSSDNITLRDKTGKIFGNDKLNPSDDNYENLTESEIEHFVNLWKEVYSTNTFDTYIKMYDSENFIGIKRTYKGQKNIYDYEGWKYNKINEFQKYKPEIYIENMRITSLNRNMKSTVYFNQTWVSNMTHYADTGEKMLILTKRNGEIIIQHEELLYSKPLDNYFFD